MPAGKLGNELFLRTCLEKLENNRFFPALAGKAGRLFWAY